MVVEKPDLWEDAGVEKAANNNLPGRIAKSMEMLITGFGYELARSTLHGINVHELGHVWFSTGNYMMPTAPKCLKTYGNSLEKTKPGYPMKNWFRN